MESIYYKDYEKRISGNVEKKYFTDKNCEIINKAFNDYCVPHFGYASFDDSYFLIEIDDGTFDFFYGERGMAHDLVNIDNIYDAIDTVCYNTHLEDTPIEPEGLKNFLYNMFDLERNKSKIRRFNKKIKK